MSVRPVAYAADGSVTVLHDELGHGGSVAFAGVRFGRTDAGGTDAGVIDLTCPVCGQTSFHPVGGGASPGRVQLLFLRTYRRRAALLGIAATFAAALAAVKARVGALDGLTRWRLENAATEDDVPNG